MKKIVIGVSAVIATAGAFALFAPEYQKDKVLALFTSGTNERQCFDYHKNNREAFKDPSTAYLSKSYVLTKESDSVLFKEFSGSAFEKHDSLLIVVAQAKNSYGAYGKSTLKCVLVNEQFDRTATVLLLTDIYLDKIRAR
jgi:hypothetical protein